MKFNLSPIILFVYNRPWHTEKTLKAIMANTLSNESVLYIYSDGPKSNATSTEIDQINNVREIIKKQKWCKKVFIIEREENIGLAQNILSGVTEIIKKYGTVIVLEDDIVTSKFFLEYMNKSLQYFKNNDRVFHINGYNNESNLQFLLKDIYFMNFMNCWGWATWEDRWDKLNLSYEYFYNKLEENKKVLKKFDYKFTFSGRLQLKDNLENKIQTWAVLWYSTVFFNNGLCLTPKKSLVNNIGMDGSGIHCEESLFHKKPIFNSNNKIDLNFKKIALSETFLSRLHLKLFLEYGSKFIVKDFLLKKISKLKLFK